MFICREQNRYRNKTSVSGVTIKFVMKIFVFGCKTLTSEHTRLGVVKGLDGPPQNTEFSLLSRHLTPNSRTV